MYLVEFVVGFGLDMFVWRRTPKKLSFSFRGPQECVCKDHACSCHGILTALALSLGARQRNSDAEPMGGFFLLSM